MELGIPPAGGVNTSQLNMQQAMESSIQNLQANVQKLPIGTILNAIVSGADKNGNLVVKFAGNDLVLSSPFLLNKGANLQLKLESISGSITAEVLSVDGKLPPSQPQQTSNDLEYDLNQHTPNNPSLKLLKVLPEGMTKLAEQANIPTQTGHAQRAEAVNVSTSQTTQAVVKALVIQPMPAIMQGLRANIVS